MNSITIIGAGLSGSLLALNLLKHSFPSDEVTIKLIDRESEKDLGPAYSTKEEYLLLNVPAVRMGAFSEDPEHFLKWVLNKGIHTGKWDFLPRRLYREYIQEQLSQAFREKKGKVSLERIRGEITKVETAGSSVKIFVQQNGNFITDKVVLALGNFPPGNPPVNDGSYLESKKYIQNPWSPGIFSSISPEDTVLFIGTGQTMVDLIISLSKLQHKGK